MCKPGENNASGGRREKKAVFGRDTPYDTCKQHQRFKGKERPDEFADDLQGLDDGGVPAGGLGPGEDRPTRRPVGAGHAKADLLVAPEIRAGRVRLSW